MLQLKVVPLILNIGFAADSDVEGSVADYRSSEMISILCILRIYCFVICSTFQVVGILKKS